jgi:PAS domain-containing protein
MARPTLSLRFRIAVTIFCLEAVMVGLVLFVTLRHSLDTARAQLTAADRETMALLHDSARVALLTDEFADVQAFIENLGSSSRIRFVAVVDLSGQIMASSDAARIGTRPSDRAGWGAWPNELMPIGSGRYRLGWLAARFSDENLLQANRTAYRLGIGTAVAGMLVIALVGATMGHLLTRRLGRLAAVADQVSDGNLALGASLEGNDEVARVGRAFDAMVDRLRQRLETIRLDRERLILPTETIHEGFALWDPGDRLVLCNQRFRELLGQVGARVELGTSYQAFIRAAAAEVVDVAPDDLEAAVCAQVELHRAGGLPREFGLRDGRWIRVSKSPMPDGSVVGIYTDITEAKHRELALRDSERRLRAIMDSVGEGIVVLDASGRVEAMNPAAAAIFGRTPDDGGRCRTSTSCSSRPARSRRPRHRTPSGPAPRPRRPSPPRWWASGPTGAGSPPRCRWRSCAARPRTGAS